MKPLMRELEVYEAVTLGLLEINERGEIWKLAEMRGNRWNHVPSLRKIPRRRAEHDQGQYLQVRRMTGARRTYCLAHRLVWVHFNGPIPEGMWINHKDGNKKNNHPANLELCTPSENMKHAYQTGLKSQDGEKNPAAKLTNAQVQAIRTIYAAGGVTQQSLATRYGVAFQTVSKIVRGVRRQKQPGVTADYTFRRKHSNIRRDPVTQQFRGP